MTRRFDPAAVRADFPALATRVHGRPLVYLDSAATAQKPRAVAEAVAGFYAGAANVHRGVHLLSERATDGYERARRTAARFLGVATDEVVFTKSATEAINLVARSFLAPRLAAGDEILVTELEHHANIVPWQIVAQETGARVVPVAVDEAGEVTPEAFAAALGPRTRLAAVTHVSNVLGTVVPLARLAALARERGVPVLVDGAQAAPHLPLDVAALGVDFYAVSGHKVFGPSGVGLLWGRAEHLSAMPPYQGGGGMIRSVSFDGTTFADPPARFEGGTPNIEGVLGLAAAFEYLEAQDRPALLAHEDALVERALAGLEALDGVTVLGRPRERAAVLSFVVDGVHPHDLGTVLDRHGVAIRAGHHCAQPLMRRYGVPATARASFAFYNTEDEVEVLLAAVRAAQEMFGR